MTAEPIWIAKEIVALCEDDDCERDVLFLLVKLHQFADMPIRITTDDKYDPYLPLRHRRSEENGLIESVAWHHFRISMRTGAETFVSFDLRRDVRDFEDWFYIPDGEVVLGSLKPIGRCLKDWIIEVEQSETTFRRNEIPFLWIWPHCSIENHYVGRSVQDWIDAEQHDVQTIEVLNRRELEPGESSLEDAAEAMLRNLPLKLFQRLRLNTRFISFDQLRKDVWGDKDVTDRAIERIIERLKTDLGDTVFTIEQSGKRAKLVGLPIPKLAHK